MLDMRFTLWNNRESHIKAGILINGIRKDHQGRGREILMDTGKETPSEAQKQDHDKYYTALKKQQERVEWVIEGLDDNKLTRWEYEFVESVQKQSEDGKYLSDKQMEIIERIGGKKSR